MYICTEQTETEIGMMILAYRSGIPQSRLRKGMSKLTREEINKIDEAFNLAEAYTDNFETIAIEDPSADAIEKLIRKYIKSEDIQYVFFDYIFTSPSILQQFGGRNIREDTVLRMFSTKLKQIAVDNNIFIRSATQLNDGWSKNIVGERNQNCRRGAKAIADKIDVGLIGIKARQEELNKVQSLIRGRTPNQVIDVYKNRDGEYTNIKLFRYFDYGTCQGVDLFATNDNYELIEIKE